MRESRKYGSVRGALSGPCDIDLSTLNPKPHAIAVYASRPPSPVAPQHSLPSARYCLLALDLHRLDRTVSTCPEDQKANTNLSLRMHNCTAQVYAPIPSKLPAPAHSRFI
jgi:hypothetical protein